jgi:two-component system response regulator DegU
LKVKIEHIKALLVDNHTLFHGGLTEVFAAEDDIRIVGQAQNALEAIALTEAEKPDAILLDIDEPMLGAEETIRSMLHASPSSKILVLTMYEKPEMIRRLLSLGASAYITKDATRNEVVAAVRTVHRLEDRVVLSISRSTAERLEESEKKNMPSTRELEILSNFPDYQPARLAVVDNHDLSRAGLRDMLMDEPDFEIVGEAKDGLEALELCRHARPDVVLMDLRMPRMDGLTATQAIKQEHPEINVLVMTMHENPEYLLRALRAGAAGYIFKDDDFEDVVSAVSRVLSGESPLAPELAAQLLRRIALEVREPEAEGASPELKHAILAQPLTPRETEVLEQLAQGKTNRQIANGFVISIGTVKNHVEHVISKLGVFDRTQAVVQALRLGIISYPEL